MIISGQENVLGCFVVNFIPSHFSENNTSNLKEKSARKYKNITILKQCMNQILCKSIIIKKLSEKKIYILVLEHKNIDYKTGNKTKQWNLSDSYNIKIIYEYDIKEK